MNRRLFKHCIFLVGSSVLGFALLVFCSTSFAVDTTPKSLYPKDRQFCVVETRVAYNGSNDTLETVVTCDGETSIQLEGVKVEKNDDLKGDSKQFTHHVKKMLDQGYKVVNCQTLSPTSSVRYSTRYACSFNRTGS